MQVYENVSRRWTTAVSAVGANQEKLDTSWSFIQALYNWPVRAYHNLDHIQDCLNVLDDSPFPKSPSLEIALILHDAVYVPGQKDNEENSALFANFLLQDLLLEVDFEIVRTIQELIRATAHNNEILSGLEAFICDIDLSILGRSPEEYEKYSQKIRLEYKQYTDKEYNAGRTLFLEKMLNDEIFHLPVFREKYSKQATINMGRELTLLRKAKEL